LCYEIQIVHFQQQKIHIYENDSIDFNAFPSLQPIYNY